MKKIKKQILTRPGTTALSVAAAHEEPVPAGLHLKPRLWYFMSCTPVAAATPELALPGVAICNKYNFLSPIGLVGMYRYEPWGGFL